MGQDYAIGPLHQQRDEVRQPAVLILSDSGAGVSLATSAIEISLARVAGQGAVAGAPQRLTDQAAPDAVLIEIGESTPADVTALVNHFISGANRSGAAIIISAALDQIDGLAVLLQDEQVTLLCAPTLADRVVALQLALAKQGGVMKDSATDLELVRLRRIADEVGRIARALATVPETSGSLPQTRVREAMTQFRTEPDFGQGVRAGPSLQDLRAAIRARRMRDQYFPPDLFADPAWDMLLDLLAARMEEAQVAVSSLCIASAVPPTTALRWIGRMTNEGIFERVADPQDGRRIFIRLSDQATDAMTSYWIKARQTNGSII